ncbi:MAG: hypothetical protein LUG93_14685 [Lachnospiraceae bacterium]|nr:hypothetical protein [Lachnospiraceae bacterium]
MIYSIHVTLQAERDMDDAANYIASTFLNPDAAYNLLVFANDILNSLDHNPERNRPVDDPLPLINTQIPCGGSSSVRGGFRPLIFMCFSLCKLHKNQSFSACSFNSYTELFGVTITTQPSVHNLSAQK